MRAVLCLALCAAVSAQPWGPFGGMYGGYGGFGGPGPFGSPYGGAPGPWGPYGGGYAPAVTGTTPLERLTNILSSYPRNYVMNSQSFRGVILQALGAVTPPAGLQDGTVFAKITGSTPYATVSQIQAALAASPADAKMALGITTTTSKVVFDRSKVVTPKTTGTACAVAPAAACPKTGEYCLSLAAAECFPLSKEGEACTLIDATKATTSGVSLGEGYRCAAGLVCDNTAPPTPAGPANANIGEYSNHNDVQKAASPPALQVFAQCRKATDDSILIQSQNAATVTTDKFWTEWNKKYSNAYTLVSASNLRDVLKTARAQTALTSAQTSVANNLFSQLAFPQTAIPAGVLRDFLTSNPTALTSLLGKASSCKDSTTFNAGWGKCSSYAVGGINHAFCRPDGAEVSCPVSCGTCGVRSGLAPRPPFPGPPPPFMMG